MQAISVEDVTQPTPAFARRRSLGWAGAALAAAAAITLLITNTRPSGDFAAPFVEAARISLTESSSGVAETDSLALAGWFQASLGYPVSIPAIAGAELQGGRLSTVNGVQGAAVLYRLNGSDLTYFALPTGEVSDVRVSDDSQMAAGVEGVEVVLWGERGEARALAAAISRARLEAIAEECRRASL